MGSSRDSGTWPPSPDGDFEPPRTTSPGPQFGQSAQWSQGFEDTHAARRSGRKKVKTSSRTQWFSLFSFVLVGLMFLGVFLMMRGSFGDGRLLSPVLFIPFVFIVLNIVRSMLRRRK